MTCPCLAFLQLCYPLHSFVKNHTKVVTEAGREQQELCSFFCTITALSCTSEYSEKCSFQCTLVTSLSFRTMEVQLQ